MVNVKAIKALSGIPVKAKAPKLLAPKSSIMTMKDALLSSKVGLEPAGTTTSANDYPYGGLLAADEDVKGSVVREQSQNDNVPPLRPIEGGGGPTSLESTETRLLVEKAKAVERLLRMAP